MLHSITSNTGNFFNTIWLSAALALLLSACNLSVTIEGQGRVSSEDGKINCPQENCDHVYSSSEDEVVLFAEESVGYEFTGFKNAETHCSNGAEKSKNTATCRVKMNINRNITALFQKLDDTGPGDNQGNYPIPNPLPYPSTQSPDSTKPIQVYILSGQSNMVGMGETDGLASHRYIDFFTSNNDSSRGLEVSVYSGAYDKNTNYERLSPKVKGVVQMNGPEDSWPKFDGPRTDIARGYFRAPDVGYYQSKTYKLAIGYGSSTENVTEIDFGQGMVEVYRKNPGQTKPMQKVVEFENGRYYPIRITYFKQGWTPAWIITNDPVPGSLVSVAKTSNSPFYYMLDANGDWTVRNDVWYKGVVSATANKWLTVGCGAGNGTIGPELGLGHVLGYFHDEPVLILKTSIGNRSLGWDILPPGSERYTIDGVTYAGYGDRDSSWSASDPYNPIDTWYAGKQYDDYVAEAKKVLDNFDQQFPQFKGRGYKIAGFGWFQGHKDSQNAGHAARYETNMVNLINSFRKDFNAPNAPFVIATIGFDGWSMSGNYETVAKAQLAVSGETGRYPSFRGNVKTVETRDYWRSVEQSPKNQGYHYNRNAETYMLVGEAMGRAMVDLKIQ